MNIAIITAGGIGTRMRHNIPKQFMEIYGKPLIVYTLEKFQNHRLIDLICVVCIENYQNIMKNYIEQYNLTKVKVITLGGETNQESIKNGVKALKNICTDNDIIIVHDGNRPLIREKIITETIEATKKYDAVSVVIDSEDALSIGTNNDAK